MLKVPSLLIDYATTPYSHQRDLLLSTVDRKYFGYLLEPGTGKTKLTIDLAGELFLRDEIDCLLVLAPNGVHEQWLVEQVPLHMPTNVEWDGFVYRSGGGRPFKENANSIISRCQKKGLLLIVTMNFEAVNTDRGLEFCDWLLYNFNCLMTVDESTRIRNHKAQRTQKLLELAPMAKYRRILSGTPVVKGLENLWAQMNFLSPTIIGSRTFIGFRTLYCIRKPIPGVKFAKRIVGYKRVKELMTKIDPHVKVLTKKECLDLPEKIYTRVPVPFTEEQDSAYRTMKEQLIVELERELPEQNIAVQVQMIAAARIKLRQIAIGFIIDEERIARPIKSNRYDSLLERLDEAPGKSIVWSSFIYSLAQIEETFKRKGVPYVRFARGNTAVIKEFNDPNGPNVFLGNPMSAGIGLNLAVADTMIFFNDIDDAEFRWQAEDRAHRIGQLNHLNVIDLFAQRTVDVTIRNQREKKLTLKDLVMEGKWREALGE